MSKKNKKKNKSFIDNNINNQINENMKNNNDNNENEVRYFEKYQPIHVKENTQTEKELSKNQELINVEDDTNQEIKYNNEAEEQDVQFLDNQDIISESLCVEDDTNQEIKFNNEAEEQDVQFLDDQDIISESLCVEDDINYEKDIENKEYINDTVNENLNNSKDMKIQKVSNRCYFGYYTRLIMLSIILIILFILAVVFAFNSFDLSKDDYINYTEKSNIDYKVYLKENNFYETDFLIKDRIYVASLIDNINIDFNYKFTSDKNINSVFKYDIIAKLLITDFNNQNVYYEKNYTILPEKEILLNDKSSKNIMETININYEQYNKIANNFKNSYALNTKSKLIIYFNIDKNFLDGENIFNNDNNKISLEIPLSEKSVEIKLDTNDINNDNKILLTHNHGYKINIYFILLFLLVTIVFIITLVKLIKYIRCLTVRDNCYDSYINKLLNEYDRLIVKTNTPPYNTEKEKKRIVEVENFEELLDVRDNVKKPIMYYIITKHIKCQFYIKNDGDIYITTIKRVDLEDKNENT